ncbi:23S rRNA (adenine(2503)-C(8))-methyltransferase Cfr [Paenibacillus sp. MY03]|uniref:Cfr family 23S rRNA (adenine(2503)-C(8))-methyltransferase n=1 Tax=Paenibacillus sp. MY03 TaxID=302980 RepID=UPI000B3C8F97|nr:Cfr family 23S rRNA (adenine(2503)-C(8))-methyltransferase [Paenibacillus sp. MY03]OUS75445.1 23S rRNA (adenine(2503)-C(8))-methyltransferase Cfr [Paenibacillus sp. MY03]
MKKRNRYERISDIIKKTGQPDYRYKQITDAIFKQGVREYNNMGILPKGLRDELMMELGNEVCGLKPAAEITSKQANRLLFGLEDGERVEAVRLSYERGWDSYCISSQCGCGFGCSFCATGTMGLKRNLTADEITDQLLYFLMQGHVLDSVSFMGMGEALANPYLFEALSIMTDPQLFALGQRRITVSTIGIVPAMRRLREEFPQVNLTFSLHSPFPDQRSALMPINNRFPLHEVLEELELHVRQTGRKVYVAYILLKGVNDSREHAEEIAGLLMGRGLREHLYHVNLIPYNATDGTGERYSQSERASIEAFVRVLRSRGMRVTVRTQFGSDINAGCGQLYGSEQ